MYQFLILLNIVKHKRFKSSVRDLSDKNAVSCFDKSTNIWLCLFMEMRKTQREREREIFIYAALINDF